MCGSWLKNLRWEAWTADRDSRLNVPMSTHEPSPDRPPAKASWTGVSTYFVLAFVISWGGVAAVVGFDGFPGTAEDFRVLLPMVVIAMLAGPSVAGVAVTALFFGKRGLHDLWDRFRAGRVGARW